MSYPMVAFEGVYLPGIVFGSLAYETHSLEDRFPVDSYSPRLLAAMLSRFKTLYYAFSDRLAVERVDPNDTATFLQCHCDGTSIISEIVRPQISLASERSSLKVCILSPNDRC